MWCKVFRVGFCAVRHSEGTFVFIAPPRGFGSTGVKLPACRPSQQCRVIKEAFVSLVFADSLSPPVNVTIKAVKANSAVVTWDIPEGDPVIGFAITQQVGNNRHL